MSYKNFTSELFDKYLPEKEESQKNNEEKYYKYLSQIITKIKNNEELTEKEKEIYDEEKIKKIKNSIDFIKRDIDRTYYTDFFLKEGGKEMLKNVLEYMCGVPGNVGYCQGMNFIVGSMLSLFRKEETALYIFSNLIQKYDLTNLFAYNTPDYGIRVFQLNYYVRKYIPSIYHHFKNNNLSFDMIYSRWLLTLFANYLEINRLDFPWSCIFSDGWKGIIKICLILLYELKEQLLKCDLEKLSNLLKEETVKYHNNYMSSFFLYQKFFKVKNKKLKELRNEYFIDLARKKLEETNSQVDQWAEDQKQPLNEYLEKKNNLELESQKKIENFKIMNEEANKKYLVAFRQYSDYMKSVNLFKQDFALQLVFDLFLELGHSGVGLLQFGLEGGVTGELGLEKGRNTVHLGGRNLDSLLLAFQLDQFLANQVVDYRIAKLGHHLVGDFLATELLGPQHLGKAIDLATRNAHLFHANHVKALAIHQLGRGHGSHKQDCGHTTRNQLKRTHYLSLLKILTGII